MEFELLESGDVAAKCTDFGAITFVRHVDTRDVVSEVIIGDESGIYYSVGNIKFGIVAMSGMCPMRLVDGGYLHVDGRKISWDDEQKYIIATDPRILFLINLDYALHSIWDDSERGAAIGLFESFVPSKDYARGWLKRYGYATDYIGKWRGASLEARYMAWSDKSDEWFMKVWRETAKDMKGGK